MATPLVSVIIPAYNAAASIGAALDSVVAQRVPELEVLVVDDGSRDDTAAAVAAHPVGARLLRQANAGPAAARNAAAAQARGEWLAFLDADDVWFPERLALQLAAARAYPAAELWCGDFIGLAAETATPPCPPPPTRAPEPVWVTLDDLAWHNSEVATSAVLVRRTAFAEVGGFDTRFRGPEDYDLWLRLAARRPLGKLALPLVWYREHPGSLSHHDQHFLPQVLQVLEKAYGPGGVLAGRSTLRKAQAYQYQSCAWMAVLTGAPWRAVGLVARSLWCWPWPLRAGSRPVRPRLLQVLGYTRTALGLRRRR
jgi:glycosyltransferase involved in cell wall biosynthesis